MITRAICRVLVDREEELSILEDALLAACRGAGSVVALAGDAGIGKSRLCTELATRAERIGATVMEGACSEADLALPYLPFLEAVGNYVATTGAAGLSGRLGVHARELARVFPQLGVDTGTSEGTDSADARLRLFEGFLALLEIAAEPRGLLLIIEDLHWADASTRELLDYVTRRLRNRHVLLLVTYRSDEMHRKHPLLPTLQGWQRSRLAQIIHLDPLQPDGVARMVSSIFDNTNVGNEFRDFIHTRSEGNPFVLEEMLKAAIDHGDIYREENNWQRKPIADLRIPSTVRDTILLRLERLEPDQISVLRCAAVLGRTFDYRALIALTEQDQRAVEATLQTAVLQQLLEESGTAGRYRFRHALTQEAIYDDLSAPARERLHSAAADVLLKRTDVSIAEVAHHLRAANRWEEAIGATIDAADQAQSRRGYDEAAALYELLLPVVTTGIERARLLCRLGEANWAGSRAVRAVEPLEEGLRLLDAAGETTEAAHYRLILGRAQWERSQPRLARAEYEKARQSLEPAGPSRDLAMAYMRLAGLHIFDVDPEGCRQFADLAIQTAEAAGADDVRIWSLGYLGLSLDHLGDYDTGVQYLEQSAQQATEQGLHDIARSALHNLVGCYADRLETARLTGVARRLEAMGSDPSAFNSRAFALVVQAFTEGDMSASLQWSRAGAENAEAIDNPNMRRLWQIGMGMTLMELDRLDESRPYVKPPNREDEVQDSSGAAGNYIRFCLAAGDLHGALEAADFLLSISPRALPTEGTEGAIEVLLASGRRDDAERLLESLALVPAPAARPTEKIARAHLLLADGDAAGALNQASEAAAQLEAAGEVVRSLRARLFVAETHRQAGDTVAAEKELRHVEGAARDRGLLLLQRQARERLAEMGVEVDEVSAPPKGAVAVPVEVGERLVTVMFADVRGYSGLSEGRPPPEIVDRIATLQRWSSTEVERHFGVVDKFAGDAVMATFNVAGTQVDHARDALEAALALRDKANLLGLPVGVGIATGAAVVGHLSQGANLSVIGLTTNLAARLQAAAGPGEILLSDETRRRVGDGFEVQAEQLDLKGFDKPVTAYRLRAPVKPA